MLCRVGSGSSVAAVLGMRSEENEPKNGEPTVGFSFVTVFQHTGRFWLRIFQERTMWQHWSIPHTLPTWLLLGFYPFPPKKSTLKGRRFCDATDIITNATEGMDFHEMASSLASNTFIVADKRTTLKEI